LQSRNSKIETQESKAGSVQPEAAEHPAGGAGAALDRLAQLTARLRGPDGCPWDRAQDYDSMKALLLEEAYEVIDAVDARDFAAIEDELGDLIFQVVFYSRLAQEEGRFKLADVLERVYNKLVRRHPHVFGEIKAATAEEALKSWNSVKEQERAKKQEKSLLDGMVRTLPALLEAHEIGVRVAEAGFDWAQPQDVLDKVEEELKELRQELASSATAADRRRLEEELGDLLFSASQLARHLGSDAETCLRHGNQKFRRRFQVLESEFARRGCKLADCDLAEMEVVWSSVKAEENQSASRGGADTQPAEADGD
jgi:ATP diphosphatase